MRKHTLYLLLAGWGLLAASCYDDKSTLQTTHIPPVEIEVPEAIASQLTVVHNARLDITGIRITNDGRENPEELTYCLLYTSLVVAGRGSMLCHEMLAFK